MLINSELEIRDANIHPAPLHEGVYTTNRDFPFALAVRSYLPVPPRGRPFVEPPR